MNIDEMPAGREMDMLIAEVMGWDWVRHVTWDDRIVIDCLPDISYGPGDPIKTWPHINKYLPPFSNHLAYAWEIVDYLQEKGYLFSLRLEDGIYSA